jgi:hypothetical protein
MDSERFTEFIVNPDLLNESDIKYLGGLIKEYPYFQLAHVLLLYNLKKCGNENFDPQLRESAIHIPDRRKLYNLLYHNPADIVGVSGENAKNELLISEPIEFQFENSKPEFTIDEPVDKKQIIADETKQELLEIDEKITESENEQPKIVEFTNTSLETVNDNEDMSNSGFSLIDKFIEENPAFTPNKLDLVEKRDDISVNSIQEDDNIVTETLATIFEMQKLYEKAISVYEKLILKFPEKSAYFASRISELKKNIK